LFFGAEFESRRYRRDDMPDEKINLMPESIKRNLLRIAIFNPKTESHRPQALQVSDPSHAPLVSKKRPQA
jgi:hypothetical protein